jgi:uncharacterized membrane protein
MTTSAFEQLRGTPPNDPPGTPPNDSPGTPPNDTPGSQPHDAARKPTARGPAGRKRARRPWLAPTGLVLLTVVPVTAGAVRLVGLAGAVARTPDNERFFASPVPVVVHIICASVFCVLGAFQFVPGFRRRRPGWHRRVGRVLVACGLGAALSGLWMTLFYPRPPEVDVLLEGFRFVFGTGMLACLVLGLRAIRRRDVATHRAWITRAYAIGMGAGTQVFTILPWVLVAGNPTGVTRALLMAAGWVINLAIAEWLIRRRPGHAGRARRRTVAARPP